MRGIKESWGLVLAGGDGSRLHGVTTTEDGVIIPKQYCSLTGTSCLFQDALKRARSVAMKSQVATVVAAQHRRWWSSAVADINDTHVLVQPLNRGTANGILFGLVKLESLAPNATVTLLPADHYFRDQKTLIRALRATVNIAREAPAECYLLGADPECPDPELGYILPTEAPRGLPAGIAGFKEKPSADYARELLSLGALWNLFIIVGSVKSLLGLIEQDYPTAVGNMREALEREANGDSKALDTHYQSLQPLDFARDILEVQAPRLRVLRVPRCGWTDLGTPKRVEAVIRKIVTQSSQLQPARAETSPFFDLSARFHAVG